MDIISMQTANKVLKKMNTEYGGLYETQVATEGQTEFTTTKDCSIQGHVLHVYVDGFTAYEGSDYSLSKTADGKATVTFLKPMQKDSIILFTTEIVGIPKFEVVNPPYDDTQVKADIVTVKSDVSNLKTTTEGHTTEIQNIKSALDDNGDGSIVDTIANIKKQWGDADSNLQTLIDGKASTEALNNLTGVVNNKAETSSVTAVSDEITAARNGKATLKEEIDDIKGSITQPYDDTIVKQDIATNAQNISTLSSTVTSQANSINELQSSISSIPAPYDDTSVKNRLSTLESKSLGDFTVTDNTTGWPYKLIVNNGTLSVDLLHKLATVTMTKANENDLHTGDSLQFTATSKFDDNSDATPLTTFTYSSSDETIATINNAGLLTAIAAGDVVITLQGEVYGVTRQATMSITILTTP